MFFAFDRSVRTNLAVVALASSPRLEACLAALREHAAREDFTVTVVLNADAASTPPEGRAIGEDGVLRITSPRNLGWAGGLHLARAQTDAEYLVWVQDDMVPLDGWLDALVEAADALPKAGAVGAVAVDDAGEPTAMNAGFAMPAEEVDRWGDTDDTASGLPAEPTAYGWVTSRGLLTRTTAWDETGGPDPSWFPLNHVDKDYSTHLRAHGWSVYLAPTARLLHERKQSAPSALREFLGRWQRERFNDRWGPVAAQLPGSTAEVIPHECAGWKVQTSDPAAGAATAEASRIIVPFSRFAAERLTELEARFRKVERFARESRRAYERERSERERLAEQVARLTDAVASAREDAARFRRGLKRQGDELAKMRGSRSWRITRPARDLAAMIRRARRERTRSGDEAESPTPE